MILPPPLPFSFVFVLSPSSSPHFPSNFSGRGWSCSKELTNILFVQDGQDPKVHVECRLLDTECLFFEKVTVILLGHGNLIENPHRILVSPVINAFLFSLVISLKTQISSISSPQLSHLFLKLALSFIVF